MSRLKKRHAALESTIGLGVIGVLLVTTVAYRTAERIEVGGLMPALATIIAVVIALTVGGCGYVVYRIFVRTVRCHQQEWGEYRAFVGMVAVLEYVLRDNFGTGLTHAYPTNTSMYIQNTQTPLPPYTRFWKHLR
jgi:uncharacterized membrane protein